MNEAYISVLKAPFPSRTCIGVRRSEYLAATGRSLTDVGSFAHIGEVPARRDRRRDHCDGRSQGLSPHHPLERALTVE